jgi:dephospho-CoA kinase
MIKAALTGGIGSGKSVAAKIFSELGARLTDADQLAKDLYKDTAFLEILAENFGAEILGPQGLRHGALADIVFSDPTALAHLNDLVHPRVMQAFQQLCDQMPADSISILETAIVHEAALTEEFQSIICVYAPVELCVKRVMQRDNTDRERILKRMANQWAPEKKAAFSDLIIINDDTHMLIPQVIQCYQHLKAMQA